MKVLPYLTVLLALFGIVTCSSGHREPFADSTPAVRDLDNLYSRVEKSVNRSDKLSLQKIGAVEYGNFKGAILCVRYRDPSTSENRKSVFIDGGVHGDEPAGVAYIEKLIESLAKGTTPLKQYDVDIIPVVNPWGWSRHIRFNKDGLDINRDFKTPKSQEAKIILDFFRSKSYDIVFDLHEDPEATGVYVYQYGRSDTRLVRGLLKEIESSGYSLENEVNMILLRTKKGLLDAPMWGIWYVRITDQLSMSNYCRLELSKNVFTIETPPSLDMEKRIFVHKKAVRYLTRLILNNDTKSGEKL